jgi:hypothetical protein
MNKSEINSALPPALVVDDSAGGTIRVLPTDPTPIQTIPSSSDRY